MPQSRSFQQMLQSIHRILVVIMHPQAFQLYVKFFAPPGVLCCNPAGAASGVALKSLNASEREHVASTGIAPVCAQGECTGDAEGRGDLPCGANRYIFPKVGAHKSVMNNK